MAVTISVFLTGCGGSKTSASTEPVSTPPASTTYLNEGFDEPLNAYWGSASSGTAAIINENGNNVLQLAATNSGEARLIALNGPWPSPSNYSIRASLRGDTISSGSYVRIIGRYVDSNHFYDVAVGPNGKIYLYCRNGSGNNIALGSSPAAVTFTAGAWYTVRVDFMDSTINVYWNESDTPTLTATDSTWTTWTTTNGLPVGVLSDKNVTASFDNIIVTSM